MDPPPPAAWQPQDPASQARGRGGFARQTTMKTLGPGLVRVPPVEIEIELSFREDLCPQHGFLHAGVVTAVADSACGDAASSPMPPAAAVPTVEFKVNGADVPTAAHGRQRLPVAMPTTLMARSRSTRTCRPARRQR
jgi:hypothetical protein